MYKNFNTARFSTKDKCSNCGHMVSMIVNDEQICMKCGVWFYTEHLRLPFVVARAVEILRKNEFYNTEFKEEELPQNQGLRRWGDTANGPTLAPNPFSQKRLEFEYPDKWRGCSASLRWFETSEERSYQYFNKVSRGKALRGGHVPGPIVDVGTALTQRDQAPGSLFIADANVNCQYAGRKFIRFEQAYAADAGPHSVLKSLIVRAELSWDHDPADGLQPPMPWPRVVG